MPAVSLIFPHQLFRNHPSLQKQQAVYLVEETLFFRQYFFHQQKLVLHRASMQFYADWLRQQGYTVHYIETTQPESDIRQLIPRLAAVQTDRIDLADPADNWLYRRLQTACRQHHIPLQVAESPGFLTSRQEGHDFFEKKPSYFQTDFYIHQRRRLQLLLDKGGKPLGGKWSFDKDNRKKFPKKQKPPAVHFPRDHPYLQEARQYVATHFSGNYGRAEAPHYFACTFDDAARWLEDFLQHRFAGFGDYEDAIVAGEPVLHHSVLTPMLNTGLLTPDEVLDKALTTVAAAAIPLNDAEGFIRQIIGWREYIRLVYEREGSRQRTTNYWGFRRRIPPSFWRGETGIPPLDATIRKVLATGYCHHIERLMVLGNFMLLCEFDPDEVYRWFMELFTDAYDWVMVPNVYGMTQFADGGLMTTKPYISGSNYLLKMGDYAKGDWQQVWDGLFWRFMHVHRHFFLQNPRLGMLVSSFDKMTAARRQQHLDAAAAYLERLDAEQP